MIIAISHKCEYYFDHINDGQMERIIDRYNGIHVLSEIIK